MSEKATMLFDALPQFPVALPDEELALLNRLRDCEWPDNTELSQDERPIARRLAAKGLIKITRQKMDPISIEPDWFAGLLPAANIRTAGIRK